MNARMAMAAPAFDYAAPRAPDTVVARVRRGIAAAGLDCTCLAAADAVLDRVDAEEELLRRSAGLADARKMRDAIVLALALLGELDLIEPDEPDRSAFHELAGLFHDIADFAVAGAEAALRAEGARKAR